VNRLVLLVVLAVLVAGGLFAEGASPLVQGLEAEPVQATYLSRHPEILRWIGKHPQFEHPAKNPTINAWVAAWPSLAKLLASDPTQTLAWAEDPQPLADLVKKGHE